MLEEHEDIKLMLALILSNQALIMSSLATLPGMPKIALNQAGEVNLKRAAAIEKEIRAKHGLEQQLVS